MTKDVGTAVRRRPARMEQLRAGDADRQQIADHLRLALDEGRLTLAEYDERVRAVYAARTYAELTDLVEDLPEPGSTTADVQVLPAASAAASVRKLPLALVVLWTIWAALVAANVAAWAAMVVAFDGGVHPWPLWVAGPPGAALLVVTMGVQVIRRRMA